jgi:5-methylcytosine-specific restriction protein A
VVPSGATCPCRPAARKARHKAYDAQRGSRHERGYDNVWARLRNWYLADNPLCEHCLLDEVIEPAVDVDHVIPIKVAPDRRLDPTNLQSLCRRCHNMKTAENAINPQHILPLFPR